MIPGLYIDKETKHWQEEYAKGNLDDEDMSGEIRCLLDGTAEEIGRSVWRWASIIFILMPFMFVFGLLQARWPESYESLQLFLTSIGVGLGTGLDPTGLFVIELGLLIVLYKVVRKSLGHYRRQ